ncbi:MAG: hypothetical protein ABJC09_01535 [Terriglobia bacterium]
MKGCSSRTRSDYFPLTSCIFLGVLLAVPAFGYVDPNTTGLITQVLGPVLVIAATAATFLRKQVGAAFSWLVGRGSSRK